MQQKTPPPHARPTQAFFEGVIEKALSEIRDKHVPIFTFAFFHSHEDGWVCVCVDTKENSAKAALSQNIFGRREFGEAVKRGDMKWVGLWQANTGRNLSVGDFVLDVAETDLAGMQMDDEAYLSMIRAVMTHEEQIVAMAVNREELLFCCSSADGEVGYTWTAAPAAA